jgi:lipoate-protein ligase A
MAVDEALLACCGMSGPTLRLYTWTRPAVSLGYRERPPAWLPRARAAGLDVVRRPTGGGAVVHAGDLTYAVAAPLGTCGLPDQWHAAYDWIRDVLLEALASLGFDARPARAASGADRLEVCFAGATGREIELRGRKLVGSAQRRTNSGFLQHGSIRLRDDGAIYADVLGTPLEPPVPELARHAPDDVSTALERAFANRLDAALLPGSLSELERRLAAELESLRDSDDLARPPVSSRWAPLRADSSF